MYDCVNDEIGFSLNLGFRAALFYRDSWPTSPGKVVLVWSLLPGWPLCFVCLTVLVTSLWLNALESPGLLFEGLQVLLLEDARLLVVALELSGLLFEGLLVGWLSPLELPDLLSRFARGLPPCLSFSCIAIPF